MDRRRPRRPTCRNQRSHRALAHGRVAMCSRPTRRGESAVPAARRASPAICARHSCAPAWPSRVGGDAWRRRIARRSSSTRRVMSNTARPRECHRSLARRHRRRGGPISRLRAVYARAGRGAIANFAPARAPAIDPVDDNCVNRAAQDELRSDQGTSSAGTIPKGTSSDEDQSSLLWTSIWGTPVTFSCRYWHMAWATASE